MGRALEMILTGRVVEAAEARDWGLVNEVVAAGAHLERALEIAEGLAAFPQPTMLSDRRAALEGAGLPTRRRGSPLEARLGRRASLAVRAPRGAAAASPPARAAAQRAPAVCKGRPSWLHLTRSGTRSAGASRSRPRRRRPPRHGPASGRSAQLGGEQVVDLEDAGGVVHLDLDADRALVAGARSRPRRSPRPRARGCRSGRPSTGRRERPWAMSSASATRTTPASTV